MSAKLGQDGRGGLERLCKHAAEHDDARVAVGSIKVGAGSAGIERMEAWLHGQAFSPHRHDTYAIGITLTGVQSFLYRGERRYCLPYQCHVLYPDELHDGVSGNDGNFSYRIIHIDPSLLQQALGGKPLPFVADPVLLHAVAAQLLSPRIWDMEDEIDDIGRIEIVASVADAVARAASNRSDRRVVLALDRLLRVRDLIAASPADKLDVRQLESVSGLDRWSLARQFRIAFGTSPSRFRTMRQLDRVRQLVTSGTPLADAAAEGGFADQGHMTRMFKRTYGLTPAKWVAAVAARSSTRGASAGVF